METMTGETEAAQARDHALATKFAVTIPMAMAADHAAPLPLTRNPITNAATAAGIANGTIRRISSRSGSAPPTLFLPVA